MSKTLCLICSLVFLTGCMGTQTTHDIVIAEPGAVVIIAQDKKIRVSAKRDDGKEVVTEKNLAGMVAVPITTYREMREAYIKTQAQPGK